jgi:hypothetical protein
LNPSIDNPGLEVQLSNFSFVSFSMKKGEPPVRRLRFTLILAGEHPVLGSLAVGLDGCLAFVNSEGLLVWSPPVARVGFSKLRIAWVTAQLERLVTEQLVKTQYIADLSKETWENVGRIENQEVIRVSS